MPAPLARAGKVMGLELEMFTDLALVFISASFGFSE